MNRMALHSTVAAAVLFSGALLFIPAVQAAAVQAATVTTVCPGNYATHSPIPSPAPNSLQCGTYGMLKQPAVLSTPSVVNAYGCLDQCKRNPACISYSWTQADYKCNLYSKKLLDMQYVKRKTNLGTQFWNRRCFQCAPCSNMLLNPSFEEFEPPDYYLPTHWQLENSYVGANDQNNEPEKGQDGTHVAKFSLYTGNDVEDALIQQTVNTVPGTVYNTTFYSDFHSIDNQCYVQGLFDTAAVPLFTERNPEPTYTAFSFQFTATASAANVGATIVCPPNPGYANYRVPLDNFRMAELGDTCG